MQISETEILIDDKYKYTERYITYNTHVEVWFSLNFKLKIV